MHQTITTNQILVYTLVYTIIIFSSVNTIQAHTINSSTIYNPLTNSIHYVGGIGPSNYTEIQTAINNATPGDYIYVYNGTYNEYLTINKTLTIQGETPTNTTILGNDNNILINITAHKCILQNFTIQNSDKALIINTSHNQILNNHFNSHNILAISLTSNTTNNTIQHNTFSNNKLQGILLKETTQNTILNNHFTDHDTTAIRIIQSNQITIQDNTFTHNKQAIITQSCHNLIIHHNTINKNIDIISLLTTDNSEISENTFTNNTKGIIIYDSHNNTLQHNTFHTNDQYAIKVQHQSYNNLIQDNTITNTNHTGIILQPSHQTTITQNTINTCYEAITADNIQTIQTINQNTFTHNYIGVRLTTSDNIIITHNHIENNTYGILTETTHHIQILENTITNNINKGIQINHESYNITINENIISNNRDGLYTSDIQQISCNNNIVKTNTNTGFWIDNTTDIYLAKNTFWKNQNALYLAHTNTGTITTNTFTENTLTAITLWFSTTYSITNNHIADNIVGIKLISSTNNQIIKNTIKDHTDTGFISQATSTNNTIYHNNFYTNTLHAFDQHVNRWNHNYPSGGNYWDDYTGQDTDKDGIGDDPYNIPGSISQDKYPLIDPYGSKNLSIQITTGIGARILIQNTGSTPIYQLNVNIQITGGIFNRINKNRNIQLDNPMEPNDTREALLIPIGIGTIEINVTATAVSTDMVCSNTHARIFLIFIR